MTHRLPPLNALRAFEATARHLSVKAAADELSVTPGAVSQLLKSLERTLGVILFQRVNRGIFLTEAGQSYLPPVRNAFRQIAEAPAAIVAGDLAEGRLVKLADIGWPEEFAYYLVYPEAVHGRPKVAAFRSWLMRAAGTAAAHAAKEPPGATAAPPPVNRRRSRSR